MTRPVAVIIEHDDKQADIFAAAFDSAGYDAEIILDGKGAIEQLANLEPAIIVLDLQLPYIPGKKVLYYIRTVKELAKTPVIVAASDMTKVEKMVQSQANLILLKPVSLNMLRNAVKRLQSNFDKSQC